MSEIGNGAIFYGEDDILEELQSYIEKEFFCETFLGTDGLEASDFDIVDIEAALNELISAFPDVSFVFYDNDNNYSGETVIYCACQSEPGIFIYHSGEKSKSRENEFKDIMSEIAEEDAAMGWLENKVRVFADDEEENCDDDEDEEY